MKTRLWSVIAVNIIFAAGILYSAEKSWHTVAYDNAGVRGKSPHKITGDKYAYSSKDVPVSHAVPAQSAARSVAFGPRVSFGWSGMDTGARYRIQATFLADNSKRRQRIRLDDTILEKSLTLVPGRLTVKTWDVPASCFADGEMLFDAELLEGPNAVVSEIKILSTSPTKPGIIDMTKAQNAKGMRLVAELRPRYTPFSVDKNGKAVNTISLNGTWSFNQKYSVGMEKQKRAGSGWKTIKVPGEWVMQKLPVDKSDSAAYWRKLSLPSEWADKSVKIRFNGVYSDCTVWVNGIKVGAHQGGFTPFEVDITDAVKVGNNALCLKVKSHTVADEMASGIKYAAHDLGGIPRNVTLFAVPKIHISSMHVLAELDNTLKKGTAVVEVEASNKIAQKVKLTLRATLLNDANGTAEESKSIFIKTKPNGEASQKISIRLDNPLLWHPEHPNLYTCRLDLIAGGKVIETVQKRFGFRKIEVRGNQLFVNNKPVKLHGVCRHEVYPARGRSLPPGQWLKDAKIFKEGNCNFIRTSHYPPDEAFLDACDEVGLFVEDEAPFCWNPHHYPEAAKLAVRQTLEMVERDRSHACVIYWSLGNESKWGESFRLSSAAVKALDPMHPQIISYGSVDLHSWHYPGMPGPGKVANNDIPVIFDEYSHLNAYNRHELVTDPGVRDAWGRGHLKMWQAMKKSKGCLGGALWAGIDDSFFIPDGRTVGYGTWGPIDGWRRRKPEFWHMKKAYSPIRLVTKTINQGVPVVAVENGFDDTNINRLKAEWSRDGLKWKNIKTNRVDIPAGTTGMLPVPAETRFLRFISPAGIVVDEFRLAVVTDKPRQTEISQTKPLSKKSFADFSDRIEIKDAGKTWAVSKRDGLLRCGDMTLGPQLMILALNSAGGTQMHGVEPVYAPYTDTCSHWKLESVELNDSNQIEVRGSYDEAAGMFTFSFAADGSVTVAYDFDIKKDINPRQVGLVFDLPKSYDKLHWKRNGLWSVYPSDHIGRLEGTARAFEGVHKCGPAGTRVKPNWSWSKDGNELGSNDFRSTKESISFVSLSNRAGSGINITSDGSQHARAWVSGNKVRLLVADYNNPGAERFFRRLAKLEDKPLKSGDRIKGSVRLRLKL